MSDKKSTRQQLLAEIADLHHKLAAVTQHIEELKNVKTDQDINSIRNSRMENSPERYREIADNIREGLIILQDNRPVYFNNQACDILGYSRDELMRMSHEDLWSPGEKNRFPPNLESLTDTSIIHHNFSFWAQHKDGTRRFLHGRYSQLTGGPGHPRYLLTFIDMTNEKLAEDALKESEAFDSSLIVYAPNPILVTNTDLTLKYVNPAFESLTGFSSLEVIGTKPPYPWWITTDIDQYLKDLDKGREKSTNIVEKRHRKKNGDLFWVTIYIKLIRDEGKLKYDLSNWVDITERKKMEEQIVELYQKEKNQRQELQEENQARGLFIDVLAHELRTPLTPILASASMLQDLMRAQPDNIQKKLTSNISRSASTLTRRLEELLDLARYTRGTFKLQIQPVDAKKYIEEIVSRFKPSLDQRRQKLVLELSDSLLVVDLDQSRIEQVLFNLLSNASKFSPDDADIYLRVRPDRENLLVEVQDSGMGITQEEQKRLFQPYHRVEQDRQKFPGLGLGLSVSKQIILAHGGNIWVESKPGMGSIFIFTIPIKPNNALPSSDPPS
jgi:PAS domain S-box-containing protein